MLKKYLHLKLLIAVFLVMAVHAAMGSFTGSEDRNKNKYSLKNLSSVKYYSLSSLYNSGFQYKGSRQLYQQINNNGIEINSFIKLQKGNTTYVYPYKYVIKLPKFKTPVAPLP
ncbi:MAG: hypothetical protein ACR2FN_04780 [Chitinophagaceae bacterium]